MLVIIKFGLPYRFMISFRKTKTALLSRLLDIKASRTTTQMINGTPEIMCLSIDRHKDFIKMPFPEKKAGPFVQKQIVYHDSEPMRSS